MCDARKPVPTNVMTTARDIEIARLVDGLVDNALKSETLTIAIVQAAANIIGMAAATEGGKAHIDELIDGTVRTIAEAQYVNVMGAIAKTKGAAGNA